MKLAPILLALTLTASAQSTQPSAPQFTDPANLRGERVQPRDGRELPIDQGASGLEQLLRRLNTRASIMNIVAHPDDEDGGMLTLYSRGLGAHVADLSLNRGEGGQNAMTADFEDALGLLRTQELLASDRYTGVDQFFGTEVDFGFSKTKEEAFAKWTHDRVLFDLVRAIRLYRPLVLTSTWIGGVTDGHGQHQVSGQIAQEAFLAAGDPKVFPELTAEGILPWQPLRIYARVPHQAITDKGLYDYATNQYVPASFTNYVTGEVTTTVPSTDVVVHEGTPDPLLEGKSYVQFARLGLAQQKSQVNPNDRPAPSGAYDVPYHLYGSKLPTQSLSSRPEAAHFAAAAERPADPPAAAIQPTDSDPNFFTGIDTSLTGIASLAPHLPMSFVAGLKDLNSVISRTTLVYEATHAPKSEQNNLSQSLLADSLSDALKRTSALITGIESANLPAVESASVLHELRIKRVQLNDALALSLGLRLQAVAATPKTDPTPDDRTNPKPLDSLPGKPNLTPTEAADIISELTGSVSAIHQAHSTIQINGQTILCDGCGDVLPRESPPVTARIDDGFTTPRNVPLTRPYFNRSSIEQPVYDLLDPNLRNAPQTPSPITVTRELRYNDVTLYLSAVVEANVPSYSPQPVNIVSNDANSYRSIGYGDLPRTIYYPRPKPQLHNTDLKLPTHHHIAYLPGTGDSVPEALASIGLTPTILTVADLTSAKLKPYDTVILGVRTYVAHPDLHGAPTQALLDYARNGGNVVVQYQTPEFNAADAPYPLSLGSNEKVVDETAPVQLLDPRAPILTTPNHLTPADFNNWIEERGHGFLATWDDHYTALTETHDPGQSPQHGGLITTALGKGHWTYCAFALYRQLPEAVPGAFRLFANLLNP